MGQVSREERQRRFWDSFIQLLHEQGVKPPADRWHVVRAEGFIRAFPGRKLAELTACRVPDDWLIGSRRGLLLAREVMLELKRCI